MYRNPPQSIAHPVDDIGVHDLGMRPLVPHHGTISSVLLHLVGTTVGNMRGATRQLSQYALPRDSVKYPGGHGWDMSTPFSEMM